MGNRFMIIFPYLVSIVLLVVVFTTADVSLLIETISSVSPAMATFAISIYLIIIPLMTIRWNYLVKELVGESPRYLTSVSDYWSGMAVGWATPSNIGMDAYRAVRMTQRTGKPSRQVGIIIIEKLLTLGSCISLTLLVFPFVIDSMETRFSQFIPIRETASLFVIMILIIVYFRDSAVSKLINITKKIESSLSKRWFDKGEVQETDAVNGFSLILPISISISQILVLAIIDLILINSMGAEITLLQTLFSVSMLTIIFSIPISFGSLGVRESSYILIYSEFGLSLEQSLSLSLLNLSGILLNSLVGSILIRNSISSNNKEVNNN